MRFFLRCINMSRMACKSLAITTTTTTCGISSVAPVDKIVESTSDPLSTSTSSSNSTNKSPSSNSGGKRISTGIGIAVETPHPLTDVLHGNNTSTNTNKSSNTNKNNSNTNKSNTTTNKSNNMDRNTNNSNSGIHGGTGAEDTAVILDALQRIRIALQQEKMHTKPNTNTNSNITSTIINTDTNSSDSSISMNRDSLISRDELLISIAALVEKDAEIGPRLLAALSGDALRLLLVICTAQEYFGQDAVETQLRAVDKDCDDNISSQEYDDWVDSTVRQRAAKRVMLPRNNNINSTNSINNNNNNSIRNGTAGNSHSTINTNTNTNTMNTNTTITTNTITNTINTITNTTTNTTNTTNTTTNTVNKSSPSPVVGLTIPWRLWHRLAWSAAVPFVAFGFLDNVIFVTVGNTIDQCVARTFGLSTMAAAALGGVVSGTAGIQVHGLAERLTQRSKLAQAPQLSSSERQSPAYYSARRMGSTMGMMLGLVLGMTPLFFLSTSS